MLTSIDHDLFRLLTPTRSLSDGPSIAIFLLAQWTFVTGPLALIVLWIFGDTTDRQAAVGAAVTALIGLVAAHVISSTIPTPRPFMEGLAPNYLAHGADGGFPSDHATLLFGIAFGLLAHPPSNLPRLWVAALGLAIAVGWSRVALGVHFPLDVAGAALIAAACAALTGGRLGHGLVVGLTRWAESIYRPIGDRLRPSTNR